MGLVERMGCEERAVEFEVYMGFGMGFGFWRDFGETLEEWVGVDCWEYDLC